nr:response regulator transcription factor [Ardenticatena sp.]
MTTQKRQPITLAIANKNVMVAKAFKYFLSTQFLQPDDTVVIYTDLSTLIDAIRETPFDILLLDDTFTFTELFESLHALQSTHEPNVILLTDEAATHYMQLIRMGVRGIISKQESPQVLFKAIEKVLQGEAWLERHFMATIIGHISGRAERTPYERARLAMQSLSEREHEVVRLVCMGLKNEEIANRLYVSESTIRHHLSTIYRKLNVRDRVNLVIFAYQYGMVAVPEAYEPPVRKAR